MAFNVSPHSNSPQPDLTYRVRRVPKGHGRFRRIYIAEGALSTYLARLLPTLKHIQDQIDVPGVSFAFTQNRNCAQMALRHVGRQYTLSLDLKDFFDSITKNHILEILESLDFPMDLVKYCFVEDRLPQGFRTSPLLSNIAFSTLDRAILSALEEIAVDATYTRYADDLVISFDNWQDLNVIKRSVRGIVESAGFQINDRKTRLQSQANGRIVICGIAVDSLGLHPTRKTMKRLRAALHQGKVDSVAGLHEWSKCKLPRLSAQRIAEKEGAIQKLRALPPRKRIEVLEALLLKKQIGPRT